MTFTIGLVGNPNSGKTTVFNALTGSRQRVGNWPGVTVERKSGFFKGQNQAVEVIDLPGTYSLTSASESSSIDERIACEYILTRKAEVIVNVVDASNLERNLYLTTQLIEMRVPVIVAMNMMDIARQRRTRIDLDALAQELGCPVVALEANKAKGIKELKQMILQVGKTLQPSQKVMPYLPEIHSALNKMVLAQIRAEHSYPKEWLAVRLLEDDVFAQTLVPTELLHRVVKLQHHIRETLQEDADILLADARYRFIQNIMTKCVEKNSAAIRTWTSRLDSIVLNRVLGIPIFFRCDVQHVFVCY